MSRPCGFGRMGPRGFDTAVHLLGSDQKVNVIAFVTFVWVHVPILALPTAAG